MARTQGHYESLAGSLVFTKLHSRIRLEIPRGKIISCQLRTLVSNVFRVFVWFGFPAKNTHKTSDYLPKALIIFFPNIEMVLGKLDFASSASYTTVWKKKTNLQYLVLYVYTIKTTRKNVSFSETAHLKSKAKMSLTSGTGPGNPHTQSQ